MNHVLPLSTRDGKELHKLNKMRYKMRKPSDKAQEQHQRKQSTTPDPSLQQAWFNSMRNVLEEIDQSLRCIGIWPFRFLDIGCCPGGFSSYILGKNPFATGVGISLSVESGGHPFLLEEDSKSRFELIWGDINRYQLGPSFIDDPDLQPFPFPFSHTGAESFDFVLMDGHPLHVPGRNDDIAFFIKGDQLLISQLVIGLSTISLRGGTIIMKLSKPERVVTSQLMFLFDVLSLNVRTWKPVCMHATRATFYLVAKGFGLGSQGFRLPQIQYELMCLWVDLMYANNGMGRRLQNGDLDFIVDPAVLKYEYAARHRELSHHIWLTQAQSIKGWQQAKAQGF